MLKHVCTGQHWTADPGTGLGVDKFSMNGNQITHGGDFLC